LATAEDERDMTSEKMELVMVELNATNETLIRVKATPAPINTFQSNNHVFNVKMMGLPTYNGTRTLDTDTSFLSTLPRHFGPHALEIRFTDECGSPLTNGWAAVAQLQFRNKAAVWANHCLPAHASAGVTWEDFSTAVKEVFIPSDAVTRLKRDWESLHIKGGERVSAFNTCFQVLPHWLEPHAPLADERFRDSYQIKLESDPEASKALIEKFGKLPTASLNDVMDHVFQVDVMFTSKKQPMLMMLQKMEGKLREDGGGSGGSGSNDRSCYACGEVGHPAQICPNKEKVLSAWREKKLDNDKKGSDEKQKERADRRRGSRGGHKKGGNRAGGGGKQQSLHLTLQAPGEGNDAKEPRVQEMSDDSNDGSDDSSSENGNGSN
jgi:hypothetical protein